MCCENRAGIRSVTNALCIRPINREKSEEEPYAAMMHMRFRVPSGAILCRTFGLSGEQVSQMEDELKRLREE